MPASHADGSRMQARDRNANGPAARLYDEYIQPPAASAGIRPWACVRAGRWACGPDRSSWRVRAFSRHSSARPWDNRQEDPTWPDIRPGSRPEFEQPKLPDSAGWEVVAVQQPPKEGASVAMPGKKDSSPGFPSAGTVLIEPARMQQQGSQQQGAAGTAPAAKPVQQQTVLQLGAAAQQAQQQEIGRAHV